MRIVCAGAGYVSIEAAPYIKQQLPTATVTLINRDSRHATVSHIPELLSGVMRLDDVTIDLEKHCKDNDIEFVQGTITGIDRINKLVHVGNVTVHYDLLLIDLGSAPDTQRLPGLEKALARFGPLGMLELRQHVVTQFMKLKHNYRPEHRTFVVAGAGVTGIETVSALRSLIKQLCEQHCIFPEETTLVLVEQDSSEYPLRKTVLKKVQRILEDRNIEFYPGKLTAFTKDGVELADRTIETETVVWAASKRANTLLSRIGVQTDEYGALIVNDYFQTSDPFIFAAGDDAHLPAADHHTIPRTAFIAYDEQAALAENIVLAAKGKKLKPYHPPRHAPVIITTSTQTALLVTPWCSWHGTLPHKMKRWVAEKYARRIQKA